MNRLPPLLVTALMTPPSAPPNSAEMPLVLTCTSWRYSNTVFCRERPSTSELVTVPSTVNVFSAPLAPLTWKPPSISPWFTDGAVERDRLEGARLRQAIEFFGADVVRDQGAARVDERRRFAGDLHRFGERADANLRVDAEGASQLDGHVRLLDLREALQLEADSV